MINLIPAAVYLLTHLCDGSATAAVTAVVGKLEKGMIKVIIIYQAKIKACNHVKEVMISFLLSDLV